MQTELRGHEIAASRMTREQAIAEITRRLVDFYEPVRIYLFGSVARGDGGPDSDLDFLVVVPEYFGRSASPWRGTPGSAGYRVCEGYRVLAANRF